MESFQKWYLSHTHSLHLKRLQSIKDTKSLRIDNQPPKSLEVLPKLQRDAKGALTQKLLTIQHENELIYQRLKTISLGNTGQYTPLIANKPTSLNFFARKKKQTKIDRENQQLLKKLRLAQSTVSVQSYTHSCKERKSRKARKSGF